MLVLCCANLFYCYGGWVKITEEGYNYALFMTRRQGLQRESVGFFLFVFVFVFPPLAPQTKNLKIHVVSALPLLIN